MAWVFVAVLPGGRNWCFTPVVEGDWFRLTWAATPDTVIKGLVVQAQLNDRFDYRRVWADNTTDVLYLPKPPCFTDRQIGLKQYWDARAAIVEVWQP